jgi:pimeloyl-ACP methyl ester carboxylesterase
MFPNTFSTAELERLSPPTLLLLGDAESIYDASRPANRARRYIRDLHVVLIPDAGHLLNMEQMVNREIASFLSKK